MKPLDPIRTMSSGAKRKEGREWEVPAAVLRLILSYGVPHNGVHMSEALNRTRFVLVDSIASGIVGITLDGTVLLSAPYVRVHEQVELSGVVIDPSLPALVYHELVHRTQIIRDGWVPFLFRYVWQWIRCGFSYDKMKSVGYELEAYTAQRRMVADIMGTVDPA